MILHKLMVIISNTLVTLLCLVVHLVAIMVKVCLYTRISWGKPTFTEFRITSIWKVLDIDRLNTMVENKNSVWSCFLTLWPIFNVTYLSYWPNNQFTCGAYNICMESVLILRLLETKKWLTFALSIECLLSNNYIIMSQIVVRINIVKYITLP